VIAIALSLIMTACAVDLNAHPPVPALLVDKAAVGDLPNVRYWGDSKPGSYSDVVRERAELLKRSLGSGGSIAKRQINILSISGGGADGAFGAGLLAGWTQHGSRPKFDFVSGVSTGAMTAPLAFLGAKYDSKLREAYTTLSTDDVATPQAFAAVLGLASSLASTKPLEDLIARFLTAEMMAEIAEEHRKGRILMIGTTNLEAQRSVIWDLTAIAASSRPESLALMRRVILASAAIPGAFPPVDIKVVADGKPYHEMHVDGGVTRQVFLYPPGHLPAELDKALGWKVQRRLFVIRNAKLSPEFKHTPDKLIPIATRSISTLIKTQGIGDLYQIHTLAKRDGADYNLAYIPTDFTLESKDAFDKEYMNVLFQRGYELGRRGYAWHKSPPGLDPRGD
jgi:predicted acylesterase/phospholipase RssA